LQGYIVRNGEISEEEVIMNVALVSFIFIERKSDDEKNV